MDKTLDELVKELQTWAQDYWAEGKVVQRQHPGAAITNYNGYTYYRKPGKVKRKLYKNSWKSLLSQLLVADDPQAFLEEHRPFGHPKAKIQLTDMVATGLSQDKATQSRPEALQKEQNQ